MISASSHLCPGPDPAVLPSGSSELTLCLAEPCKLRNGIPAQHRAGTSPSVAIRPRVACLQDPIQNALRPALRRRERAAAINKRPNTVRGAGGASHHPQGLCQGLTLSTKRIWVLCPLLLQSLEEKGKPSTACSPTRPYVAGRC